MSNDPIPAPPIARKHPPKPGSTAPSSPTTTPGCAKKKIPRSLRTSRPKTPTPRPLAPLAALRDELYRRCSATSSRPTSPFPTATAPGGTTRAPWRGCSTPSTAASAAQRQALDADAAEAGRPRRQQLAEGHAFFAIGDTDISDDGRWLAYSTDTRGFRQYTLHIKDLDTGETLPGEVERVGSVAWAADNRDPLLHRRRRAAEAPVPAMAGTRPARSLQPTSGLSGRRRALQPGRGPHPRRQVSGHRVSQPHHHRVPRFWPPTNPSASFTHHRSARRRARVFHRPSQRPLVHPHQRPRPQLPPRHRARRHARPRALDRTDPASRRHHA